MRYHKINFLPIIYALLLLWAIHVLTSCSAAYHFKKGIQKDRVYFAKVTRDSFPCVNGKVIPGDSSAYKEYQRKVDSAIAAYKIPDPIVRIVTKHDKDSCPDLNKNFEEQKETINKQAQEIKDLNILLKLPAPAIHDTLPVKDSAEIVLQLAEINKLKLQVGQKDNQITEKDKVIQRRGTKILYLIIALLLSLIGNILQVKKRIV